MMKGVVLVCLVLLFTEMQFDVTQPNTICNSPQYLELGKEGIITCQFHKDFFAVWWYTSIDFRNGSPTVKYQNKLKSGPGYESGEFDVHPNGSLIVTEVLLKYEDVFTVVYLPTKEVLNDFIHVQVIVIVKPGVPFPLITQCGNVSNKCFTVADEADMECFVGGARPQVLLDFTVRTVKGDKNISRELVITPNGDGYTSTVTTSNAFHLSPLLVLLVCKASTSIPGLLDDTESIALVENGLIQTIPDQTTYITIQRYERMELHCTENENAFIVWKKAIPPRYVDYELLLYSVNFGQGFNEIFAEDIILEHNVSLVLPSVDVEHEGNYVCLYGDGISDGVRVYNVSVGVIAYPAIDGCNNQPHCELQREYDGSLTCSVEGIRPNVELQWKAYFEDESDLILFSNPKRVVKDNGESFDVTLIVQYHVSERRRERLTVECRVVSTNDLMSNLAKKMDLLFVTGNHPTTEQTRQPKPFGFQPLWVLVVVIVSLVFICGVTMVICLKKKFQSNAVDRNVEEETRMLEAPSVGTSCSKGKRHIFLEQLKERYKDLFNAVKPVPYFKDGMYCVNNVFIDGCITFKDSDGKWIGLDTYQNVFSDPRIKSKRLLLEGEPGYGKSTVALQYAYDWCNSIPESSLKDVDILILLRLRQLGGEISFYRAIKQFLLPKESILTENDIKTILLESNSVVMLLDGFDEYPDQHSRASDVMSIIAREMFPNFIVLLTTRSSCLPLNYSPSTKRLRLTGFTSNARKYYICKAVVNNEDNVKVIERYIEQNPILRDLCQVPLLFVLFAHMAYENEHFRNLNSTTIFFRHMISCLYHHMKNKTEDVGICNDHLLATGRDKLSIVAFRALNENRKRMVWRKEELCKELDQKFYDLYNGMGILVEEEVLDITDEPFAPNSNYVQYRQEVRFYHKIFCEWHAAHYLSAYIQQNSTLELNECLQNIHPVDYHYLYRFACGINSTSAKQIIRYLAKVEGGDKFAILCILEQTGNTENVKETITQLCSEGVIISACDSLLLQRSTMQLLEISAGNEIPIKMLHLHKCFKSVGPSSSTLNTTSDLVLSSRIPVEQLGLRLFHKRMSDDEYIDILNFSTMCPSLNLLGLYGSPPPKSFTVEPILSKLSEKNVRVKYYGSYIDSPVYNLNLLTGQWESTDEAQCTEEDFTRIESEWKTGKQRDVNEIRRVINEYRKRLRLSAKKGNGMSGNVNGDDSIKHGEEDIDIMAQLRIARNRTY